MLSDAFRRNCLRVGLAFGLVALFGLILSVRIDGFTYVLAHERDILRSFGDLWSANLLRGPEVKPGDRIWGGGYYLLLHLATFFGSDWLRASARFAVLLHAGLLTLVTLHAWRRGWRGAYLWYAPLLLLLSTTLAENLAHLWNPTFLPFFLALALFAAHEASTSDGAAAWAWVALAAFAALFCTQIHASAWVLALAFPLALAHERWRAAGRRGGPWILVSLMAVVALAAVLFPEAARTRWASLHILRDNLFTFIEPLRAPPVYRWSLAARNLVDIAALTLVALALRPSRDERPTLYARWLSWAMLLAALPAIYAVLWYFPSPHNFKHRYCLAFVVIAAFRALDRRPEDPSFRFAWLAALGGSTLWLVLRWGAPAPLQPEIGRTLLWLAGGVAFVAVASWRGKRTNGFWLGLIVFGAATGLWAYQSAASPLFYSHPVGSFLTLSQGRAIANFIKEETSWPWAQLSRRLFLVGLQSNSAFTYFYENVARESQAPPTPLDDRRLAFVFAWPAEITGPSPGRECGPELMRLLGESHEWLAGLLAKGEIIPKACLVTHQRAGVAILELAGGSPAFAAVSNYGYAAFDTFPHWDCAGPGADRAGRECVTGWWHRSSDTPGTLWIGIEGSGLGDREANRYFRWHALGLEYELSCGGSVIHTAPLVPRTRRTELAGQTLFPSRWSMMMDHQILAPTSWRIPDPCGRSTPVVKLRWRGGVQYGAHGETASPGASITLEPLRARGRP